MTPVPNPLLHGPFHDWYEIWRSRQIEERAARDRHRARLRQLSWLIVGYTGFLTSATIVAIWAVMRS